MSTPRNYHIFGHSISQSLSPTIHNAGFAHHGLPHHYDIQECADLNEVTTMIDSPDFGGCSITMPHKLSASKFCTSISASARTIGAINTLIATSENSTKTIIHGDNTDWSGLHSLITEYTAQTPSPPSSVGLVIGAGGAARAGVYAMIQAGVQSIYIGNRTYLKAEAVARDFESRVIPVAFPSRLPESPDLIIGTVPGESMGAEAFAGLFQKERGLCIEMSYKPRVTNLLVVAREHRGWVTADGLEVLLRQAFDQFRLWSGREPPQAVMRQAVMDVTERVQSKV
ncbi:hypothetical protein FE257_001236 [Aspergillus nanangensis]|uniref:Shikimate dehydrogenase substrate binding N-terminal domain-containing protein n=1 Tax=Aspergillus nanangensis TaxID=2582783 RepID=A0AAD4CEA0_ASPNN|nr:hypothetical protein FE257_001236 [Aspergillus nanangensis]